MAYTVLIPARLASSRLPNKPLADIGGVPMVVRVAQRVLSGVPPNTRVVVAADSPAIMAACEKHDIEAILTREDHLSGSDRLAEAATLLALEDDAIVVNVQGDEPLIDPALVHAVAATLLAHPEASMGTAAHAIDNVKDFANPNVVKVVLDTKGLALYFSRAPIAWWRDGFAQGIHALPQPAPLRPRREVAEEPGVASVKLPKATPLLTPLPRVGLPRGDSRLSTPDDDDPGDDEESGTKGESS